MATAAQVNTLADAASAAVEAGDFATGLAKLRAAQILLAAIPDQSQEQTELRYDRRAIEAAIATCQMASSTQTGIQYQKVRYVRPEDC